jgi:DNA-binding MarR family transcriptional regulator
MQQTSKQIISLIDTLKRSLKQPLFYIKNFEVSIGMNDYILLNYLYKNGPTMLYKLSRELYFDSIHLSKIIDSLEKKQILNRFRSPEDRRNTYVDFTLSGTLIYNEAKQIILEKIELYSIEEEEFKVTVNSLMTLQDSLTPTFLKSSIVTQTKENNYEYNNLRR